MGNSNSTNFTQCGFEYMNNDSLIAKYGYDGPVIGIAPNKSTQITYKGCQELCGRGTQFYDWRTVSSTITTWVLPVIGMLLQAPFESNAFWRTLLALIRWVGSPIASLSYILWNIKVSGKCAMIGTVTQYSNTSWQLLSADPPVDMAIKYQECVPGPDSDFASIRDSLYILMIMNQFKMKPNASRRKETEGLLRIVLFSKDLKLVRTDETLKQVRQRYATDLRAGRKRGVVPVFISALWFLFSLAISIQQAFGDIGENETAHDLALGLLLAWLPVLILCSIVDRNPTTSDNVRKKLNKIVDKVRLALMNEQLRDTYIESFRDRGRLKFEELKEWVMAISEQAKYMEDFFEDFAGQGRVRWHYGAA